MRTQRSKFLSAALILFCLIGFFPESSASSHTVLAKLEKRPWAKIPGQWLTQIKAIQELRMSWIVEIPVDLMDGLAAAGFACSLLDPEPEGKSYFLVSSPDLGRRELLRDFGHAVFLDDDVSLFWTDDGREAREILPAYFELKHLARDIRIPFGPDGSAVAGMRIGAEQISEPFPLDPLITEMVAQVAKPNLINNISTLQDFQTRYAPTVNCQNAGNFLYTYFTQLGLACEFDLFSFSQYTSRNVVATLPGRTAPEREIILCAHYDSYSTNSAATLAPGADDNASGTAAVMEIARIMKNYAFDYTLKFICFSAEEFGMYGSRHYAQSARAAGEIIVGVINMDMIAYADVLPEDLEVIVNPYSDWLALQFISAANRYAPLPTNHVVNSSITGSDQSPFWDQGYSALLGIDDYPVRNPYYHSIQDMLHTLNMDFATAVTKASLASAAELAQPTGGAGSHPIQSPTGLQARSRISSSLFSSVKSVYLTWNAPPGAVRGYNVYRTTTSRSGYQKINSSLVTQTSFNDLFLNPDVWYYYIVTAVDDQDRESNPSIEVRDDQNNASWIQ
jgi:hypothetical protein